jgi:putative nucleotidyltransferase with HDIG domain
MTTAQTVAKSALLERVIATLDVFPLSRAEVIRSVMSLTANLDAGIGELSDAISTDPALTGKILRLSNSPFYGRMRQVASLEQAIMILGFQTIRSLVVATSTAAMFKSGKDKQLQDDLWRHSLAVAVASRIIAQRNNVSLSEEAFITGLMHDIAKPVLLQRFPDEYKPVIEAIRDGGQDEIEVEREMLGFTHADLCVHILEHWNFPVELTRAAGRHHDYDGTSLNDPDIAIEPKEVALSRIVCLANELAKAQGYTFVGRPALDLSAMSATEYLGLDGDAFSEIGEALDTAYEETEEHFRV